MSLFALMNKAVVIKHRNTDNDVVSATGELTTVGFDASGTTVYGFLEPAGTSWALEAQGLTLDATAVLKVPYGTDIRPDLEEANGMADKVTINSKDYRVTDVVDPAERHKFLIVGLRRSA
ncbi:MAG: hypothetical protein JRL30_01100 [Deltaproteobacteria bacterium]|nr:hypothetical protein [Deltaproteobacteria bacterium]